MEFIGKSKVKPTPPVGLGIWNIHIYFSFAARVVCARYSYRLDFVARLVRAARLHGIVILSLAQGAVGPIVVRQTTETAAVRPLFFTLALLVKRLLPLSSVVAGASPCRWNGFRNPEVLA